MGTDSRHNPNSAPGDFSDANADLVGDGYTELERYLNWLALPHYDCTNGTTLNVDLTQYTRGFTNNSPTYAVFGATNGTVALSGKNRAVQFHHQHQCARAASCSKLRMPPGFPTPTLSTFTSIAPAEHRARPGGGIEPGNQCGCEPVDHQYGHGHGCAGADADLQSDRRAVTNAAIDAGSGVFTWRPLVTQANTTNPFAVVVTDNGTPNLSATQSFNVTVNPLTLPGLASSPGPAASLACP